jgi:hypothetical protein
MFDEFFYKQSFVTSCLQKIDTIREFFAIDLRQGAHIFSFKNSSTCFINNIYIVTIVSGQFKSEKIVCRIWIDRDLVNDVCNWSSATVRAVVVNPEELYFMVTKSKSEVFPNDVPAK